MPEIETKLKILIDILSHKKRVLLQILNITENQKCVLENADSNNDISTFLDELNVQKQTLIDEIIKNDNMFQNTFDSLGQNFENYASCYFELIMKLQEHIKEVCDIDIKIRIIEEKNTSLFDKPRKSKKIDIPKAPVSYVLEKYKQNNKK